MGRCLRAVHSGKVPTGEILTLVQSGGFVLSQCNDYTHCLFDVPPADPTIYPTLLSCAHVGSSSLPALRVSASRGASPSGTVPWARAASWTPYRHWEIRSARRASTRP